MLALAQFAAGVAHDLNNHLTGILGFAAILSRSVDVQPGLGHLSELRAAAERAATLSRTMQAFGRRPTIHPRTLDLLAATTGILEGVRHHLPAGTTLTMAPTTESIAAHADASLLAQGLLDLLPQLVLAATSPGDISVAVVAHPKPTIRLCVRPATVSADLLLRRCRPYAEPKSIHGNGLALASAWASLHHAGGLVSVRDSDSGLIVEISFAPAITE